MEHEPDAFVLGQLAAGLGVVAADNGAVVHDDHCARAATAQGLAALSEFLPSLKAHWAPL